MAYEYKAVAIRRVNAAAMEKTINALAVEGWRVCGTLPGLAGTGVVLLEKTS